jgi:predicted RNA binding protein YcfA (HicA-like mRNA interferase family)
VPSPAELQTLREEVRRLRRRIQNIRPREVETILDRLSERRRGGREPYVWKAAPGRRPITVPRHGGATLAEGVARNILDDIDALIDEMEASS